MSVIGSGIISSIAGAPAAQRAQARVDDAAKNDGIDASKKLTERDVISEVEGTDEDGSVNADSEGTGASGRDGRWDDEGAADAAEAAATSDNSQDDSHLDLTA